MARVSKTVLRGSLVWAAVVASVAIVAGQAAERIDYDAVMRIKEEGVQRSRVMQYASWLTDVHGPRLTNSPQIRAAADYVVKELMALGLANVKLEPWGPFGRGWSNERTSVHVVEPYAMPLLAFPKAWTPGTNGLVRGEAVRATIESEADFEKYRGQLKGKFVLLQPMREVQPLMQAPGRRYSDEDLAGLTRETPGRGGRGAPVMMPPQPGLPAPPQPDFLAGMQNQAAFRKKRMEFLVGEGVLAILEPSPGDRGDSGSIRVQGPGPGEGSRDPKDPPVLPQLVLAIEHYGRIVRTLEKNLPVVIEADVRNTFHDADQMSFNIIAELPGTDKADEVVMIGAHFDSWHAGTGATDNGGSSAVMMEVMRILKATGLKPRRTIRMALWTGEEQGLLGSRAYVKEHFADRDTMTLKPGHAKLSVYFNMDNGGGAFRGIYLQGNEAVAPVFAKWMEPFHSMGMTTLSIRPTGGTDHQAFDAVGLPGFQFIQDPLEYMSRTHHTNLDTYERLIASDLMQNAIILASFAYHAAIRDERLPRKPLPPPPARPQMTTAGF